MDLHYSRRKLLTSAAVSATTLLPLNALATQTIDLRIWPDENSTRVTLETNRKLNYNYMLLRNQKPYRLVVDLEGLRLTPAMRKQLESFKSNDPYIAKVRVGQFKPNVMRLVFELKGDLKVNAHYAKPVAEYQHRILLDITPSNADLMKLVIDSTQPKKTPTPEKVVEGRAKGPDTKAKKSRPETLVVVIDPGHGGEDPGAIGRRYKTKEKDVVLAISRKLAATINRTKGMRAVLTRNKDVFLPLARRASIAMKEKAHIFVSVHADAWTKSSAKGSSVFTLSVNGASSLQARWLAQTQNQSDAIGGTDFSDVSNQARSTIVDMLAETKLRYGIQLGDEVLGELSKLGPLHKASVEYANFAVLKAQGVPSILVETAFLSNPKEENKLRDARHQARLADAIFKGIRTAVRKDPSLLKNT